MSRTTALLLGSLTFFVLPPLLVSVAVFLGFSEDIGDFARELTPLAQELARYMNSTEILAGIFILMIGGGAVMAAILYLLFCGIGVTLVLILRELCEMNIRHG